MNSVDVCLSPDLMHLYNPEKQTVVVVDILRATSCIVTGLAHGVESITPFAGLEDCRKMKEKGYFIAGERDGKKVEGFDIGNSPFEYMEARMKGAQVAITTTNGTQAIARAAGADEIVIGAFLNLTSLVAYLKAKGTDILIICSGWKGHVNLEDTLFAGALIANLGLPIRPESDAALIALDSYTHVKDNLLAFLEKSSHVQRLAKLNIKKDIEFCLTPDQYTTVPVLKDGRIIRVKGLES